MEFPESGVLHLLFKTPKELQDHLKEVKQPYRIINIYGVSPSRHYVALEKIKEDEVFLEKQKKKTGG